MEGLGAKFTEEELKSIFKKMDWDRSGSISRAEFKNYLEELKKGEALSNEEVNDAFKNIDKDGDHHIHWEEFCEAMTKLGQPNPDAAGVSEDEIELAFNQADMDSDGYVSIKEAKRAFKKLAKALGRPTDQDTVTKWVEAADFDCDGKISLEEFKLSIAGNKLVDEFDIDDLGAP